MLRKLLDRPIAVTMIAVVLVILGIVSSRLLPVSLVPNVDAPYITIQIPAQGVSARQLDETVITPLRQQLIQLSQLVDLRSEAREGSGIIRLTFEQGSDLDYLFIEVNERIDRSISSLPRELDRPKAIKASATDIPAFYINLTVRDERPAEDGDELHPVSDAFSALSRFASQVITKRIEQLPEVAMVDISGCVSPELLVIPDEAKLRQAGIAMGDVESALKKADVALGSLTIRDGEYQYSVKFRSAVSGRSDIENIFLKINGRLFRLKELAQVVEHPRKRQGLVLSDGRSAVSLAVVKQADARMSKLKEELDKQLQQFRNDYPEVEFTVTRDQTELLDYSISNLVNNIVTGALLACFIIFFFMRDVKSPLLVILTIPVTLIISVLVFYLLHISINIISLSGLVLGIGMMVDNSIIVIDNITARWMRGERFTAAVDRGTKEVVTPMLSSVLTTCAVFVPLIFINGMAGALFYDQAMAVAITLFVAYGVAITLLPVYYRWWYARQGAFRPAPWLERFSFDRIVGRYDAVLKWFFRRRWLMWGIYAVSVLGLACLFWDIDKQRLPAMTYSDMLVRIDWNDRISAGENGRRTQALVASLGDRVSQSTIMAGVQQFILSHTEENGVAEATVYLKCRDAADVEPVQEAVRSYLAAHAPAARCSFGVSGNVFDMIFAEREAVLTARLRATTGGPADPEQLQQLVGRIRAALPDLPVPPVSLQDDILYVARPEQMALYGVAYGDLITTLRNALNENTLFTITSGDESLPVVIGSNLRNLDELLGNTFIRAADAEIPVGILMRQTVTRDLKSVVAGAEGNYYPLDLAPRAKDIPGIMSVVRECVAQDDHFEVSFSGSYFSNRGMVGQLVGVLVVALLLLFFVLAAQFESLVQPWIILSEIVIDLFGALAVLWIFGQTLNLMSMIGLIVVCGIVINDSILKIDTINTLRRQGVALKHAIMEAGRRRLKAIVMTSLTTILAVAPFLARGDMGSDLQFPMSLVIISGMIVGTLVSIFFIPLAYYEIYKPRR
ncbi:efflux RND transporter permease subunit [uncultured Alistipes sp.]|jgi:multidrug efflux pump subunit AcrB|uniref:efflux RND transporter permease subunit n=1 Tax=uncultured Alistipes sp. TaxID=538949 RepID=UPI0025ED96A8|nr:efflux RND transporter permease subunit [uncultured Alistipes sp.]